MRNRLPSPSLASEPRAPPRHNVRSELLRPNQHTHRRGRRLSGPQTTAVASAPDGVGGSVLGHPGQRGPHEQCALAGAACGFGANSATSTTRCRRGTSEPSDTRWPSSARTLQHAHVHAGEGDIGMQGCIEGGEGTPLPFPGLWRCLSLAHAGPTTIVFRGSSGHTSPDGVAFLKMWNVSVGVPPQLRLRFNIELSKGVPDHRKVCAGSQEGLGLMRCWSLQLGLFWERKPNHTGGSGILKLNLEEGSLRGRAEGSQGPGQEVVQGGSESGA